MKISATIITLNERKNITRAIESLRCCDEVVLVDCGSDDRTLEAAVNLGARVVESPCRSEEFRRWGCGERLDPVDRRG